MTYRLGKLNEKHLRKVDPYAVEIRVHSKQVKFEVDTGCGLMVMTKKLKMQHY